MFHFPLRKLNSNINFDQFKISSCILLLSDNSFFW